MLHAAKAGVYKALFTTAALTGARSGELFALRWADIEMPKNGSAYIYIRRTVTWARVGTEKIRPRYFPPKTRAGVRKIPIADELAAVLKVWKLQCPPSAEGLVFVAADGSPIRRSNALRCGLWSALRRAGLRRVNIHSLRHSFASALMRAARLLPRSSTYSATPAQLLPSRFTRTGSRRPTAARWAT
jgi:integrase